MEPRGIRNCNPLNIRFSERNRWQGKKWCDKTDPQFEEFVSMKWGFRAAFILIHNYKSIYGKKTLREIIYTWAPPQDNNNTEAYLKEVAERVNCTKDYDFDFADGVIMCGIVQEMARVENGKYTELLDVMQGYYLACRSLGIKPKWHGFGKHEAMWNSIAKMEDVQGIDLI